jgi:hypothetical protein
VDAGQVKDILSINDIFDLLSDLGADPVKKGNQLFCRTVCHGGHKHKLIYFHESKTFSCFTGNCGHGFDLYVLIGKVYGLDFGSSFRYICGKFNINSEYGFLTGDRVDTSFILKFKKKEPQYILNELDPTMLNSFYKLYHHSWIEDGISIKTMRKFNTLFSIRENKIIIPHFDIDGRLIGIRGRALNQEEVDAGKKYMPIFHKGEVRKHPTGGNIYGLNVTKEAIIRYKTLILFESEKGPQQLDTMLPDFSIGGGISGSALTDEQVKILQSLGIENVVLGLDKEFTENGSDEEKFYKQKVASGFIAKLVPYFRVSLLWDRKNLLEYKDSPTDKGVEVFQQLWENRIFI